MNPPPHAFVAGTASSLAHGVWQQLAARWTASATSAALRPCPWDLWTAQPGQSIPPGLVYWLPTPAGAATEERMLEQQCRTQWMQAMAAGCTLRVLYGPPAQQLDTLWHCLQEALGDPAATLPEGSNTPTTPAHTHTAGLRCRECLDPDSEQRLFSRLLSKRVSP